MTSPGPKSIFASGNDGLDTSKTEASALVDDNDRLAPSVPITSPSSDSPLATSLRKRHIDQLSTTSATDAQDPRSKRRRVLPSDGLRSHLRHLSHSHPLTVRAPPTSNEPPSPLFFSHSRRTTRPPLPPRFSSGEAGARMLSQAHDDASNVKTVTLARGNYHNLSPSGPAFLSFNSRSTSDRSSIPRSNSPEFQSHEGSDTLKIVGQIGIFELLEQDHRPTFVVDLAKVDSPPLEVFHMVYANNALRSHKALFIALQGQDSEALHANPSEKFQQFQSWALATAARGDSLETSLSWEFGGLEWQKSTLRGRIRVVTATSGTLSLDAPSDTPTSSPDRTPLHHHELPSPAMVPEPQVDDYFGAHVADSAARQASPTDIGFFDWTRIPMSDDMPAHIQFARSIDWASTPLGPIETWTADLRQMCNLVMASPHAAAMYWGDDLIAMYNEAYVMLAGQKHPNLMGHSYQDIWAEIWDDVKDVFANAKQTGQATMKDDDRLFMKRSNYLEETYFSWSIIPIVGSDGTVCGIYNPAFEKTRRKIAERRMLTLREVGERTASARDVKSFWKEVLNALSGNEYDTPFALLYSVGDEADSDALSDNSVNLGASNASSVRSNSLAINKHCFLEGSLGVPPDHHCAPRTIDLRSGEEGFGPLFREVLKIDKALLARVVGNRNPRNSPTFEPDPMDLADSSTMEIPFALLEGVDWRGFRDPCRSVVVCPILPTTGENTLGFLVLGINPRRPYDHDYSLFVQLLSRQLATSLASVVLFEEEIKRGQRAAKLAALDRIELSQQLAARTQEARRIETRFTRMAESTPAGLFIADSQGHITFSNDAWYDITGIPKDPVAVDKWIEYVKDVDRPFVEALWNKIVEKTEAVTAEFRFQSPWKDPTGNGQSDTWVLFSAHPERFLQDDDAELKSVFGNITDISSQKWAQNLEKRKMEEAVEMKRQQENFIDITSHEMRNPLSAILQCADEISLSLGELQNISSADREIIHNSMDAAQTIVLCAQHQRRIVDDVLTLSKIDSQMLVVTPVDAQPLSIVQRALKMFEGETQKAQIDMKLKVDPSFRLLKVDWVKFDPQRVVQILINLMTNAIKFTSSVEGEKSITVTLSASLEKPSEVPEPLVQYIPTKPMEMAVFHNQAGAKNGDLYIQFSVQDTGLGLNHEEKKLLFNRFSQASPSTHVKFGGSGIGLHISRELTELQGGQIGVASESGKGSTFAFYVTSKRSSEPQNGDQGIPELLKSVETTGRRMDRPPSGSNQKKDYSEISVLIVEDNLVNQRVLQKQLLALGFTIHVANHGGEALDLIRSSTFWVPEDDSITNQEDTIEITVILMDSIMPVLNGSDCTKRIREYESQGRIKTHIPIIGCTANARQEQLDQLINAGMDDVVSKPFRTADLVPKLEEWSSKHSSLAPR